MSAFLCGPEHIGQVVSWGNAHGPDPVAGAEALARANLSSFEARHRLDIFSDWEFRVARKFGGYEDNEEYLRIRALEPKALLSRTAMSGEIPARAFRSDESACRLTTQPKRHMLAGVGWIVHVHRSSPC